MNTASSKYFVVSTRGTRREVESYLYSHSEIVAEVVTPATSSNGGVMHVLVRTTAEGDKAEDEARRLAQYQADRLASGLHFTGPVGDRHQVVEAHKARTGVDLDDEPSELRHVVPMD